MTSLPDKLQRGFRRKGYPTVELFIRPDPLLARCVRSITVCMLAGSGKLVLLIFTLVFVFNSTSLAGRFINRNALITGHKRDRALGKQGTRETGREENEVDRNA